MYENDRPIGPPSAETVGDANRRPTLPFARLTVTGPTDFTGAGPDSARRRFTVSLLAHGMGEVAYALFVWTDHVYTPPSRRAPSGTVHVGEACQPDVTTVPVAASAPLAIRNWYVNASPLGSGAGCTVSVGVNDAVTLPLAGVAVACLMSGKASVVNDQVAEPRRVPVPRWPSHVLQRSAFQ